MLFQQITGAIAIVCLIIAFRLLGNARLHRSDRLAFSAVYFIGAALFAVGGTYFGSMLEVCR